MTRLLAWWRGLGARERRILALGLALMASAWLILRGAPATWHALEARHERVVQTEIALARARAALLAVPVARESLAVRAQRLVAYAPRLFAGATAAEAGAELSGWVGGQATLRRVRIVRENVDADSAVPPFRRLTLRLEAEGDVVGLAAWLADLEHGPKLLALEELAITAPEPGAAPAQAERLRAELVLVGWNATLARGDP